MYEKRGFFAQVNPPSTLESVPSQYFMLYTKLCIASNLSDTNTHTSKFSYPFWDYKIKNIVTLNIVAVVLRHYSFKAPSSSTLLSRLPSLGEELERFVMVSVKMPLPMILNHKMNLRRMNLVDSSTMLNFFVTFQQLGTNDKTM